MNARNNYVGSCLWTWKRDAAANHSQSKASINVSPFQALEPKLLERIGIIEYGIVGSLQPSQILRSCKHNTPETAILHIIQNNRAEEIRRQHYALHEELCHRRAKTHSSSDRQLRLVGLLNMKAAARRSVLSCTGLLESLPVVLASQSLRRLDILQRMGWRNIIVVPSQFEEAARNGSVMKKEKVAGPVDYVTAMAREKAEDVARQLQKEALNSKEKRHIPLIIAADTVVVQDGHIFEKPRDDAEAIAMLKQLVTVSDGMEAEFPRHTVVTGVALSFQGNILDCFAVKTVVLCEPVLMEDIESYICHRDHLDKAGGYGIQSLGGHFIQSIQGCFYNVQGLPYSELSRRIAGLWEAGKLRPDSSSCL